MSNLSIRIVTPESHINSLSAFAILELCENGQKPYRVIWQKGKPLLDKERIPIKDKSLVEIVTKAINIIMDKSPNEQKP